MKKNLSSLIKTVDQFGTDEGHYDMPVKGVHCVRFNQKSRRIKRDWRACFAIALQGCKEIIINQRIYKCRENHFTATAIQLPVVSSVSEASKEKPFIALLIDLDPVILSEVASQLDDELLQKSPAPVQAFFSGVADENLIEAVHRLVNTFNSVKDAKILGPLIIREIFYHLLTGPEGNAIRQFVLSGSKTHQISKAIHLINTSLAKEIDVDLLAKKANMSRSAFFKHFSEVTSMSPIQYQKRLRLLQAKRILSAEDDSAESVAFRVGYKSASQFSREYSRMFGNAPGRDRT